MSMVSPLHDASASGCLANASLNAAAKPKSSEAAAFACCSARADAPAPQIAPRRASWRRLANALFDLVSGPTMPHHGHG